MELTELCAGKPVGQFAEKIVKDLLHVAHNGVCGRQQAQPQAAAVIFICFTL